MSSRYDAIVVGGGPAGLSAALSLGRSRRRVLVAAAGPTRNAAAQAAHNVFTRDGTPPDELVRIGREQLAPYAVQFRDEWVEDAESTDGGVKLTLANGDRAEARGVVLAMGVKDLLPDIPGLKELWGGGVFHCPYCHGWEVRNRPLAAYIRGISADRVLHLGRLIRGWSDDVVLLADGPCDLPPELVERMQRNGLKIREQRISRLHGEGGELRAIEFEDGSALERGGMILSPDQEPASDLAARLGCAHGKDGRVEAGMGGRTEVPGVYVAGDLGPGMQSVVWAMSSGTIAGAVLNHELLERDFAE